MEFTYNESRACKHKIITIRSVFFLFHLFSIYYDFNNIEKDKYFTYYLLTLSSIFLCICNSIRYEYAYNKILGHTFESHEEFMEWKKTHSLKMLTVFLDGYEKGISIFFLVNTITIFRFVPKTLFYDISCFIIYIYTILSTVVIIGIFLFCCSLNISMIDFFLSNDNYNYNRNRESIEMLNNINTINTINNVIYIDDKKECCICLDKNMTEWVRTPCDHEFHKKCINDWYNTKKTCPICRSNL
jgi:hypothetical protein